MTKLLLFLTIYCIFHYLNAQNPILTPKQVGGDEESTDESLINTDSIKNTEKSKPDPEDSEIETTINYSASDSIFFDVTESIINMYGDSYVDYGDIQLEAERTTVNWETKTINSVYLKDSTGRKIGKPIYKERDDVFETDEILYNFDTKRAVIKGVITEQGEAFIHGEDVKKNENDELFIRRARYTTCNLEDPHFFIESDHVKLIPGNKVISGPFVLKFRSSEKKSIFTPLMLPFGMFPQPKSKVSGILFPTYGEERRRGFFLRNGGYYWAVNEYVDLKATADIYSLGGLSFQVASNYKKRYAYSGSLSYSYSENITDDVEGNSKATDIWLRWAHTPQSRGTSSFSASVSAGSSSFNQNNNLVNTDFQQSINSRFTSNISYSKRFGWSSLSLNARQNQNISTKIMNLTFPEMTWNVNRINPFKKIVKNSKSPLAKLNFSYNFVGKADLSNSPQSNSLNATNFNEQALDTLSFFKELDRVFARSKIGGRHTIPISTSLTLLKYFTLSPTFNYNEVWAPQQLNYSYDAENEGIRIDTLKGFSRAGTWRSGASMNTIIYGTYFLRKLKRIEAIRHVITPSVSFSYNPDFRDPSKGIYKEVQINPEGQTQTYSKFNGFAYEPSAGSESKSIGFSVQNNIEMKVLNLKDTSDNPTKKIKIFDNLSASTSYNLAADSFQLSDISFRARTSFLKRAIGVNFSGTVDPYVYKLNSLTINEDGSKSVLQEQVNKFKWDDGGGLGQLKRFTTNISLNLNPSTFKKESNTEQQENTTRKDEFFSGGDDMREFGGTDDERSHILNNPNEYVDFDLPWSFSASYNISRTKDGFRDPVINQTLTFSGSVSLTSKTQVQYNSGYDIENKEFTTTRISLSRDLHCWSLNFNVVPFGRYQSFGLTIRPRSSLLQELKIERRKNFRDFF